MIIYISHLRDGAEPEHRGGAQAGKVAQAGGRQSERLPDEMVQTGARLVLLEAQPEWVEGWGRGREGGRMGSSQREQEEG